VSIRSWLAGLALTAVLVTGGPALAANETVREAATFGTLRAPSLEDARAKALDWLRSAGKSDEATLKAFEAIWAEDKGLLDKVAATLALGNDSAKKLLAEASDPTTAAPTDLPALLKDTKVNAYLRANLALAYARNLATRRVHEEALEALKATKPESVVDPATYLFYRAVAEHALLMRDEAGETIARLLDDVLDAPERYKMVAALMHFDMLTWTDKDLDWIARKMNASERRLGLSRGGPKTQKIQKEIIARLDEKIKELENQCNGNCNGNGGNCPNGGNGNPGNNIRASSPQQDSKGGNGAGPGNVDPKRFKELAEVWGKLPEKERAKALVELTRDVSPRYREVIEEYFKKLAAATPASK
jgi:hypothetical protein